MIISGHGGLSAISTKASPSSPSSNPDSRSPSKSVSGSVPGDGTNKSMLVMSGGEGYIDFRLGKVRFLKLLFFYQSIVMNQSS